MSNFFDKTFKKLKSVKHIEVIIAVLFGVILLALYFSTINDGSSLKTNSSATGYAYDVETRLADVLESVEGAGAVNVMVMLEEGEELNSEVVPKVSSVIVVAEGAKDYKVKIELLKAVEAILNLPTSNIEILVGNKK